MAFLDFLGCGVGGVHLPRILQFFQYIEVNIHALALPVGLVGPSGDYTLIPVHTQPGEGVNNGLIGLFGVARGIGIFDAEDEFSTRMPGIRPVEQRGADHPYVRSAGG